MRCGRLMLWMTLLASVLSSAAYGKLVLIEPAGDGTQPVVRRSPAGIEVPVVRLAGDSAVNRGVQREARSGFTRRMLELDAAARTAAGQPKGDTWLLLSRDDGGFARHGFWLSEGSRLEYFDETYVDLVVDEDSLRDGSFEEIFAHELGHVFLRRLLPDLPKGFSRTPHNALSITDGPTAFDEGFAIHFQGLVRAFTGNLALRRQDLGLDPRPFLDYWSSNTERTLRIQGMRHNWFVHDQKAIPADERPAPGQGSTMFDPGTLKTGSQMMASEGVIATLFYRWLVGRTTTATLVQDYRELFESIASLRGQVRSDSVLYLDLLEAHARAHPEHARLIFADLIETTYGATVEPALQQRLQALSRHGRMNDIESFVADLSEARSQMNGVIDAVARDSGRARAALGRDLWLKIPPAPEGAGTGGAWINLNTATREDFARLAFPEPFAAFADQTHRRNGHFLDLDDFGRRCGLTPAQLVRLHALHAEAMQSGPFTR